MRKFNANLHLFVRSKEKDVEREFPLQFHRLLDAEKANTNAPQVE